MHVYMIKPPHLARLHHRVNHFSVKLFVSWITTYSTATAILCLSSTLMSTHQVGI